MDVDAGWSSLVARRAHNPKVVGSNPAPATTTFQSPLRLGFFYFWVLIIVIHKELEVLLKPVIEDLGCELWACEYLAQGRVSTLRVYIDKPEGIDISDCEKVSHEISFILDVQLPIKGNYTLEVSSPGLDRPLFTPEHFQRYIGEEVTVKVRQPIEKRRKFIGKLIEVRDNHTIVITEESRTKNSESKTISISIADIVKANLVV